jgi:hypothetical protein
MLSFPGQAFEHIEWPWEVSRVLRPVGFAAITAPPSSGHVHQYPTDCWRRRNPPGTVAAYERKQVRMVRT